MSSWMIFFAGLLSGVVLASGAFFCVLYLGANDTGERVSPKR